MYFFELKLKNKNTAEEIKVLINNITLDKLVVALWILNAIDLSSASSNRNLILNTNAQTVINGDTDLTAKVTAATTAGWSIKYVTR